VKRTGGEAAGLNAPSSVASEPLLSWELSLGMEPEVFGEAVGFAIFGREERKWNDVLSQPFSSGEGGAPLNPWWPQVPKLFPSEWKSCGKQQAEST
jgi:hypothetical protein